MPSARLRTTATLARSITRCDLWPFRDRFFCVAIPLFMDRAFDSLDLGWSPAASESSTVPSSDGWGLPGAGYRPFSFGLRAPRMRPVSTRFNSSLNTMQPPSKQGCWRAARRPKRLRPRSSQTTCSAGARRPPSASCSATPKRLRYASGSRYWAGSGLRLGALPRSVLMLSSRPTGPTNPALSDDTSDTTALS